MEASQAAHADEHHNKTPKNWRDVSHATKAIRQGVLFRSASPAKGVKGQKPAEFVVKHLNVKVDFYHIPLALEIARNFAFVDITLIAMFEAMLPKLILLDNNRSSSRSRGHA